MNWAAAASTGFGLGLAYFGGLWLGVRGTEERALASRGSLSPGRPGSRWPRSPSTPS